MHSGGEHEEVFQQREETLQMNYDERKRIPTPVPVLKSDCPLRAKVVDAIIRKLEKEENHAKQVLQNDHQAVGEEGRQEESGEGGGRERDPGDCS